MSSINSAVKSYARALFEAARETNELESVSEAMEYFRDAICKGEEFQEIIGSEQIVTEEKSKLIEQLDKQCQFPKLFKRFVLVLVEQKRIRLFAEICAEYVSFKDESENVVRGTVTTTSSITTDQVHELEKTFSNKFKKIVKLTPKEDSKILGGLVVEIGDLRFDGSLKTALVSMKNSLERQYV